MSIRQKQQFNPEKAKQVILYILNKCGPMSKKKLQCLLYFCDFNYYEKYEEPFMGFKYIKLCQNLKKQVGQ